MEFFSLYGNNHNNWCPLVLLGLYSKISYKYNLMTFYLSSQLTLLTNCTTLPLSSVPYYFLYHSIQKNKTNKHGCMVYRRFSTYFNQKVSVLRSMISHDFHHQSYRLIDIHIIISMIHDIKQLTKKRTECPGNVVIVWMCLHDFQHPLLFRR